VKELKTHKALNHLHSLAPQLINGACNIHYFLLCHLLQDIVNADEGPSTTHTSTGKSKEEVSSIQNHVCMICCVADLVLKQHSELHENGKSDLELLAGVTLNK